MSIDPTLATAREVFSVLRESPHLVPLVVAEASCPQAAGAAAPLWCLQAGPRGCTPASTVHLSYAATEKRRHRDSQQLFRGAVCEALTTTTATEADCAAGGPCWAPGPAEMYPRREGNIEDGVEGLQGSSGTKIVQD